MRALVAVLLMSSVGWAQDSRALDTLVNRLKERLNLTEEQVAKVREIYAKDVQDRTQLDQARSAKVAELLDEDQKKQFEELQRNPRGGGQRGFGGQGGGGNNPFGGGRGMGQLNLDDLKRELTLTDEQAEKIKPILDEFGTAMQKRMEDLRGQGFQGLNIQEELQKFQESMKGVTDKIKVHLTEEQKPKLDGMVERSMGWMRVLPLVMGRQGGGFGIPATPSAPARPSVEDRVRRALEALKIEKEEERAAIAELIAKVVRAQYDLEDYIKSSRETLGQAAKDKDLSDAAVEDRINEALKERSQREKGLAALQKQLVEIVSSRQELELMVQGILK